jgi:hypothetical protein
LSVFGQLRKRVNAYVDDADNRAQRKLAKTRSAQARDKIRTRLNREKMAIRKDESEARTALLKARAAEIKAEAAKKRAQKELRDVGGGFSLSSFLGVSSSPKRRSPTRRRATAKRKIAKRKTTRRKTTKRKAGGSRSFRISFD